jgi:hypothetical protein
MQSKYSLASNESERENKDMENNMQQIIGINFMTVPATLLFIAGCALGVQELYLNWQHRRMVARVLRIVSEYSGC